MRHTLTLALLVATTASAQVMPTSDKTVNRTLPEEPGFKNDTEYKKKYEEMRRELEQFRQQAENSKSTLQAAAPTAGQAPAPAATPVAGNPVAPRKAVRAKPRSQPRSAPVAWTPTIVSEGEGGVDVAPATAAMVFAVSQEAEENASGSMTVLPAGSFVKAKVVSGVEANTLEPYPVLLQLEYAFTGPNKTRIDLSNCFMIAKARANLSTERVIMETETLSCVRENGEHFKSVVRGYTAGEDSTFGSTGTFISKQGQVLLAAVLANIAKNAGEAVALAQQTTQVVGADKAAAATNITGSKAAFVAGKSVVDGASMIAQWYLDYAKQLIPSIAIGSGASVHVVMLDTVRVPTLKE